MTAVPRGLTDDPRSNRADFCFSDEIFAVAPGPVPGMPAAAVGGAPMAALECGGTATSIRVYPRSSASHFLVPAMLVQVDPRSNRPDPCFPARSVAL